MFNELGHLRDPKAFAQQLKKAAARNRAGGGLGALIMSFGSEVGSAIYYDRIK